MVKENTDIRATAKQPMQGPDRRASRVFRWAGKASNNQQATLPPSKTLSVRASSEREPRTLQNPAKREIKIFGCSRAKLEQF
jgi:hypothetical protein